MENYDIVDSIESFERNLEKVRNAQKEFSKFSQEKVDEIFKAAALAANNARIPLAKHAVEETGMGVIEDKVSCNNHCSSNPRSELVFQCYLEITEFYKKQQMLKQEVMKLK